MHMKLARTWMVAAFVIGGTAGVFGWYVWPTPYEFGEGRTLRPKCEVYEWRKSRITGATEYRFVGANWTKGC